MKINYIPDVMSEWDCHVLDMMKRKRIREQLIRQYYELHRERRIEREKYRGDPTYKFKSGISW